MKADVRRLATIGGLLVLLLVLAVIFIIKSGEEKTAASSLSSLAERPEGSAAEPREIKKITLFFLSERDALLHPEEREIFADSSFVNEAREAICELIKGSRKNLIAPFPPETKLRELYFTDRGVLYVDFSRDIEERHPSGAAAEISTIYSVVNSLTYNFKPVKRVFILIEGGEKETLRGHIDLSRPLLPQYDLIGN